MGAESQLDIDGPFGSGRSEDQVDFRASHSAVEGRLEEWDVNAADHLLDNETLPEGANGGVAVKILGGLDAEQVMQETAVTQDDFFLIILVN